MGCRSSLSARLLMVLAVVLAIAAPVGVARAQEAKTTLVEPPAPLLPAQVGEWVKLPEDAAGSSAGGGVPNAGGASSSASSAVAANGPDTAKVETILTEDGLRRSERAVYRVGPAGPSVVVTARQFVDATGAHAAYSYYQRPGSNYRGVGLGNETGAWADGYLFRSGASVVEAKGPRGAKTEALLEGIELKLPKMAGPKGLPPLLPTYLPEKGLERESVRYALGSVSYEAMGGVLPGAILGFDKAAEVVTAKYAGKGTLTMLLYPTPQIAGEKLRAIEAELHRRGLTDGTVVLRREGALGLMTSGAWGLGDAKAMVEGIHPRAEVTWNKPVQPEFHAEVRKTYSLLTSIAIFCGFGALAAVVLGFSLGAGRAAVRVLQGKPAATEPEFLRIDLSGRPQPIHAEEPGPQR